MDRRLREPSPRRPEVKRTYRGARVKRRRAASPSSTSTTAEQRFYCGTCAAVLRRCSSCGDLLCACGTQGACHACGVLDECRNCSWGFDHGFKCASCHVFLHWQCKYARCSNLPLHRFCVQCAPNCKTCHRPCCPLCPKQPCLCNDDDELPEESEMSSS